MKEKRDETIILRLSKTEKAPTTRPSVLAALEEKVNQPEPVKPFKSYLDKEGR